MIKNYILIILIILFGVACSSCQHQWSDSDSTDSNHNESAITTLFGQVDVQPPVHSTTEQMYRNVQAMTEKDLNEFSHSINNDINLSSFKGILTFDDGPHPKTTQLILENIHTARVKKAIFFLVGYRMLEYPYLVELIDRYGYEIGYHSMFHQEYKTISVDVIQKDIKNFKKLLNNILSKDYPLKYARPLHSLINQKSSYISDTRMGKYALFKFNGTFYQNILDKNWLVALKLENLETMLWHADFNDWNNSMDINHIRYFYKGNINQMWLFHEMPLHFEIMAAFDNRIDQKLPIFLNQLYRMNQKQ